MLDLYHATRDDLMRILHDQQDQLAERDQEIVRLNRELREVQQAVGLVLSPSLRKATNENL